MDYLTNDFTGFTTSLQMPFRSTHTVASLVTDTSDPMFLLSAPWLTPSVPPKWMESLAYKNRTASVEKTASFQLSGG